MTRSAEERITARREEIVDACEKLYQTKSFKEVAIKEIGEVTTFTRTSVYNHFQTKEEIFLGLLKREYDLWVCDLERIIEDHESMTNDGIADSLAKSLEPRVRLLKLVSMNLYDMEDNSRLENIVELKTAYKKSMNAVGDILAKFRPDLSSDRRLNFVFVFFPFVLGVYPYAFSTEKQIEAMKLAGFDLKKRPTLYELVYNCARQMLESL